MIRILFFAQARSVAGGSELSLSLDEAPDVARLWGCLVGRFPGLAAMRETARLARNSEFAQENEAFCAGDEIAIIPPVSGG
jgi:molybdopterin converting factor subunit 1